MPNPTPARWKILISFALIYLVWGSTYYAIKVALTSFPPLLLGGIRFTLAGLAVIAVSWRPGVGWPSAAYWRSAFLLGLLMVVIANGGVVWAEQTVPSGVVALIITTESLWAVLFNWRRYRNSARTQLALGLGLVGIVLLVGLDSLLKAHFPWVGTLICFAASLSWVTGSLLSKRLPQPVEPLQAAGLQMFAGGLLCLLLGGLRGEPQLLAQQGVSTAALGAIAFLTVFGSALTYTAFSFLLRHVTPTKVLTHSYVNPVLAVLLGAWLAHEPLTWQVISATLLLISAVVLMTLPQRQPAPQAATAAGSSLN